jgi:hypothetical protein
MCELQKRMFQLIFFPRREAKERALSYAIGQLRVNSLTPSMSVPRQASKEGSGGERKASSQKQEA